MEWRKATPNSLISLPTSEPTLLDCPSQEQRGSAGSIALIVRAGSDGVASTRAHGVSSAVCGWDAEEQTADHIVLKCRKHRSPNEAHGLVVLGDETID